MLTRNLHKLSIVLCLAGLAVSIYLARTQMGGDFLNCSAGTCDIVLNSKYSEIFGIPVAVIGIVYYLLLLILLLKNFGKALKYWLQWGMLFSSYLTYLQLFTIRAICQRCITSFVIVVLSYALFCIRSRWVQAEK